MLLAVTIGKRRPKIQLSGFIATRETVLGVAVERENGEMR